MKKGEAIMIFAGGCSGCGFRDSSSQKFSEVMPLGEPSESDLVKMKAAAITELQKKHNKGSVCRAEVEIISQ